MAGVRGCWSRYEGGVEIYDALSRRQQLSLADTATANGTTGRIK